MIYQQETLFDSGKKAIISDCGNYRYQLHRVWDNSKPKVLFLMLNPSTADEKEDDPTIRRCIAFSKSWGYGGLLVGNLFAFRATNPKIITKINDPIGSLNICHLAEMSNNVQSIICAWGNSSIVSCLMKKFPNYMPLLAVNKKLHYLELSNDGTPKHPLYLKGDLKPMEYTSNYKHSIK